MKVSVYIQSDGKIEFYLDGFKTVIVDSKLADLLFNSSFENVVKYLESTCYSDGMKKLIIEFKNMIDEGKVSKFDVTLLFLRFGKFEEIDMVCDRFNIVNKGLTFEIICNSREIECDVISNTCIELK